MTLKEVKFRPTIARNDYNTKLKQVTKFLSKDEVVRITIPLRGREKYMEGCGIEILERIQTDLVDVGKMNIAKFKGTHRGGTIHPLKKKGN